jgi:hypothetical protein
MSDLFGIVAALAVIFSGVAFFITIARRRQRAVEKAGFKETAAQDAFLKELTHRLFELAPTEVHRREEPGGKSWLLFVDAGGSENAGCVMAVYRTSFHGLPAVALSRSGRPIPKFFRRLTGGIFKWAEPLADAEMKPLGGTGWYPYREPKGEIPSSLKKRLCEAAQLPGSAGLLGIALIDSHLAIWSDAERLKSLLAVAPSIRKALLNSS